MWSSKKQSAWGHTPAGVKALGGPSKVQEWDAATKFGSLPMRTQKAPSNLVDRFKPPKKRENQAP